MNSFGVQIPLTDFLCASLNGIHSYEIPCTLSIPVKESHYQSLYIYIYIYMSQQMSTFYIFPMLFLYNIQKNVQNKNFW